MRIGNLIDLYCGAGLFSAGFAAEGFSPVLALDLSKEAVASYRRNVAPVAECASVVDWRDVCPADVLIAGPPCQGFSTLGRQDPLDVRNKLALEVIRWAEASVAKIVVVENVPPFLNSAAWHSLAGGLESLGYQVFTWVLDAVDYGTPQFRKRAFTIASKIGQFDPPIPAARRRSAGEVMRLPVSKNDPLNRWPTPVGIAAERIALVPPCGDKRDIMKLAPELCPPSWIKVGCNATDVWGRIDPTEPANTIRCTFQNPSKGRYLHPSEQRTLSLREGARLQGIPDNWVIEGRNYPAARQIGNGVPIPLARAVASVVRDAISTAASKKHIALGKSRGINLRCRPMKPAEQL